MPQDIIIRPLILFIIILLCIYQNTEEKEKEVLRACEDGDLEKVKRLSSVIIVHEVREYRYKGSPLHIAARYVNLLSIQLMKTFFCVLHITMSLCIYEGTVQAKQFHIIYYTLYALSWCDMELPYLLYGTRDFE